MTRPETLCVLGPHHPLNNKVTGWLTHHYRYGAFMFRSPADMLAQALMKHTKSKSQKREPTWFTSSAEGRETPIPKLGGYTAAQIVDALEIGLCENLDPDFLTKILLGRIDSFMRSAISRGRPMLMLDSRHDNEIELVRALGGKFMRIKMPSLPPLPPYFDRITPDFVVDVPDIEKFEDIHDLMCDLFGTPPKKGV